MTPEEAFEILMEDNNLIEMNRISGLEDPMRQGYETAKTLAKITGQTPSEMAFKMIRTSHTVNPRRSNDDVWRDLGVLRWCFENWEK